MAFLTLVLPISSLIIVLITSLYTFISPIPKLPAYLYKTSIVNNPKAISSTQIKEYFTYQAIPSPRVLVHTLKFNQTAGANTSESNPANSAESIVGSFLNPKVLLSSAIDQIRNSTSSIDNSLKNSNNNPSLFGNYKTLLLARQIIPPRDYILLFDVPDQISGGQISAKLPCNANYTSPLRLFSVETNSGLKIETRLINLQVISGLSSPGYTCVYEATVPNTAGISTHIALNDNNTTKNGTNPNYPGTDPEQIINTVGLLNPTSYQQVLLPTSSIALRFNETHSTAFHRK